ncbi:MAG: hypothetical protein WBP59_17870 [Ilumatobacteraceae bacterium]
MSRVFRLPTGAVSNTRRSEPAVPGVAEVPSPGHDDRSAGVVAGFLAPHPPHLIYGENPIQNEPRSEGGWETLRWAYEGVRQRIREVYRPDVIVVHAPHWISMVGHHVNCVPHHTGVSVEPIFPHLFRYHYDFTTDVELAHAVADSAESMGLTVGRMTHPGMRVDYATIGSLHLVNDAWDIPVVSLSANNNPYFYSDASQDQMATLGEATRQAIEATGRRAIVVASNSLSHMHWDREPDPPEDMSAEHIYNNHQYQWDMHLLSALRSGLGPVDLQNVISAHIDATASETKAGSLTWMLSTLGWPVMPAEVLAYGTVIGTGNAIVEWDMSKASAT